MPKDLISGTIVLLIALLYYYLAIGISESVLADQVGAAGLPVVYATLLGGIGIVLGAKALIVWRFTPRDGRHPIHGPRGTGRTLLRASGMLAIGVAYVSAVTVAGYLLSLIAVIGLVALYQGERLDWRLGGIAVGGGVAFWIFFDRVLGIDMPPGFWPTL